MEEGEKKNLSRVSSKLDGEGNSKNGIHRANGNKRHLRPLGEAETLEKGRKEKGGTWSRGGRSRRTYYPRVSEMPWKILKVPRQYASHLSRVHFISSFYSIFIFCPNLGTIFARDDTERRDMTRLLTHLLSIG